MGLELDRYTTTVDGYFVLNFVTVDSLRADDADLAVWRRNEDSALRPTANGEEHPSAIIIFGTA